MLKRKKKERKRCGPFWGLNRRPSVSMHLTVILTYLNTLQSGDYALEVYYLNVYASGTVGLEKTDLLQ
jgi:hypothetical protein